MIDATTAPAMKQVPRPLANGVRAARGTFGNSRSASIHMLMAVKCAETITSRDRVAGVFSTGSSATTMGRSRMPLRPTASATSSGGGPAPGRTPEGGRARPERRDQDQLRGRRPDQQRRQHDPWNRKAEVVGERAD